MSRVSTISMWIAVVLLAAVYLFPLWEIRLLAPQYPDGLGIDIWVNKITGAAPHDLQNINGLNHYIGMRAIEPGEIPELRFMKYIVAGLIGLGAMVALVRRRRLMVAWVVLAIVLSAVGMYDFYKWEYDYGHNLDPSAAIKIPGMSYQPPLFGTKQLLNFTTTAWPGVGGVAAMLAVALVAIALLREFIVSRRGSRAPAGVARPVAAVLLFGLTLALSSCQKGPQPIEIGVDQCARCLMTISDGRYGAEVVSTKGRAYKFDSIECMVQAVKDGEKIASGEVAAWYTVDFAAPGNLIDATAAVYVHSAGLPSPMGMNLTSFAAAPPARGAVDRHGGEILDWNGARALAGERTRP